MQRVNLRMRLPFGKVEFAAAKGFLLFRRNEPVLTLRRGEAGELRQEIPAPFAHQPGEFRVVVGEKQKWRACSELLSLEEHGGSRPEQEQRGKCPVASRSRDLVHSEAVQGVRHLVMVFQKGDKL